MASDVFTLDYSEFNELVRQVEQLGLSEEEIANELLDEVESDAIEIFRANMPPNSDKEGEHARDNVIASRTKLSHKYGTRYRIVGAAKRGGNAAGGMNWEPFRYLFYVENGTSRAPAHPFVKKTEAAIAAKVQPKMVLKLQSIIKERLE